MPEATFRLVPALSTHALARLKRNEAAQRAETKRRGLPAVFVSVEALWLLYAGKCCCSLVRGEAGCNFMAMDPEGVGQEPDAPVIAHVYLRKRRGGHDPENTRLWRHQCNQAFAAVEKHDTALGDRMAVDFTRKLLAPEEREARGYGAIRSNASFQKPAFSALSKGRGLKKADGMKFDWKRGRYTKQETL